MPELLHIQATPELNRPVLLAGFLGWANAGSASSGAIEYLLGEPRPEPCAEIDAERCFDQTVIRPVARKSKGAGWTLVSPTIRCYALRRPQDDRDLVLVLGPEPSLRWQTVARELAAFVADLGVDSALMLGAYIGAVSHRTQALSRRVLSQSLGRALQAQSIDETDYEGPTAFQTMFMHSLAQAGVEAGSLWIATPPYVQGANPRAALSLLSAAARALDVDLDLERLRRTSLEWTQRIDALLRSNPTLLNQLKAMAPDAAVPEPPAAPSPPEEPSQDLPSSDEIIADLERFLRGQQPPSTGGSPG